MTHPPPLPRSVKINCSTALGFEASNREAFEVNTFRIQFSIMSYTMKHMKLPNKASICYPKQMVIYFLGRFFVWFCFPWWTSVWVSWVFKDLAQWSHKALYTCKGDFSASTKHKGHFLVLLAISLNKTHMLLQKLCFAVLLALFW